MATGGLLARSALAALVLAGGAAFGGGGADAATVYNYSFVQTGYDINPVYAYQSSPGTLTGTFSASLDPTGYLDPSTLTNVHFTFTYGDTTVSYLSDGMPTVFSYLVPHRAGYTGSFTLVQNFLNGFQVCVGLAVGLCGGGAALGSLSVGPGAIPFELSYTGPVITLLSTTFDPPVSATPIPAALPLFVSGLAGLGLIARRRRSASRPGSPAADMPAAA
ncbi:MAG TPA: hypothetical protein VHA35_10825 [Dongiaceae bacterium]|jgi:hypothetical protein|nr:hypothetical protein [Dongiaceae bacterium]